MYCWILYQRWYWSWNQTTRNRQSLFSSLLLYLWNLRFTQIDEVTQGAYIDFCSLLQVKFILISLKKKKKVLHILYVSTMHPITKAHNEMQVKFPLQCRCRTKLIFCGQLCRQHASLTKSQLLIRKNLYIVSVVFYNVKCIYI